ncbi:MAG: zf-TFIIB domain-containing protein [Pirellula sp.]|nr:zf-TFIIB domain-containing protein [Pirellula sp.]
MFCPVCSQTTLLMTERQGVEIDYCPKCRGVWLDRGELDKLIALSGPNEDHSPNRGDSPRPARSPYDRNQGPGDRRNEGEYRPQADYRPQAEYRPEVERPYPSERERYENRHPEYHKPKKRESWLGELFDWD